VRCLTYDGPKANMSFRCMWLSQEQCNSYQFKAVQGGIECLLSAVCSLLEYSQCYAPRGKLNLWGGSQSHIQISMALYMVLVSESSIKKGGCLVSFDFRLLIIVYHLQGLFSVEWYERMNMHCGRCLFGDIQHLSEGTNCTFGLYPSSGVSKKIEE
jgi:hypothetical protein